MRLFRYVMPRDFGFAPNPFFGFCTLACCKPQIRRAAQTGDIVVGINGTPPNKRPKQHLDRIIYVMRVTEALSFNEYWDDPRFQKKKPNLHGSRMYAFGDNIYRINDEGFWLQVDSHHSLPNGAPNDFNIRTDTSSNRVLISNEFVYWGGDGPLRSSLETEVWANEVFGGGRRAHRCNFDTAMINSFADWFAALPDRGYLGRPERWEAGAAEVTNRFNRRQL
jgi:hypothetical protein